MTKALTAAGAVQPAVEWTGQTTTVQLPLTPALFALADRLAEALPPNNRATTAVDLAEHRAAELAGSEELRSELGGTGDRTVAALVTDDVVNALGEPARGYRPISVETRFGGVPARVRVVGIVPTPASRVVSLAVAGDVAVTGHDNGTVSRWDLSTGAKVDEPLAVEATGGHLPVAVSADGAEIFAGGANGITGWSTTGVSRRVFHEAEPVTTLALLPDGQHLVSGHIDGYIYVWNTVSGEIVARPWQGADRVSALVVSLNETFASSGTEIVRCGMAVGFESSVFASHKDLVLALAVTPEHEFLVSGSLDHTIRFWHIRTGVEVLAFNTGYPVHALALTPDGRQIISGHVDGLILRWNAATGRPVGEPMGTGVGNVIALGVSPDGRLIVSADDSEGGEPRRWDVETGAPITGPHVMSEQLAEVVSDLESAEDRLGIAGDVHTIATVLAALSTRPPLSVALLGDWGAGKSSFMRQLRDRIEMLAASTAQVGDRRAYAVDLRQVTFNAWHYSDDHLWVGIVEHLFRELRDAPAADVDPGRVTELTARLASEDAERQRLEQDLLAVQRMDARRGWLSTVLAPWPVLRATLRGVWHGGWRIWVGLLVLGAGIAAILLGHQVLGTIGALLGPVVAVWSQTRQYVDSARAQLLARKAKLDDDIRATTDELDELDPARRLVRLLTEITAEDRYASFRGLTGRIHHDLRRLSADLATAHTKWEADGAVGTPPLQRIILYIDDLDRCAPERVVNVLQAVNLLLTMDLFMVVVAVDPKWLLHSLRSRHGELLSAGPVAYLDKIFHIPFALRPMGNRAVDLLHSLLPAEEPTAAPTQNRTPDETPVVRSRPSKVSDTPVVPVPRPVGPVVQPAVLTAEGLRVTAAERDFIARLTPLLATPRAVKKLTNLYRLLRLSVPRDRLTDFLDGPYQAAAILLTAIAGTPHEARTLLTHLTTAADGDIVDVFKSAGTPLGTRLAESVLAIKEDVPLTTETSHYQRWANEVARFGFETYDLYEGH